MKQLQSAASIIFFMAVVSSVSTHDLVSFAAVIAAKETTHDSIRSKFCVLHVASTSDRAEDFAADI